MAKLPPWPSSWKLKNGDADACERSKSFRSFVVATEDLVSGQGTVGNPLKVLQPFEQVEKYSAWHEWHFSFPANLIHSLKACRSATSRKLFPFRVKILRPPPLTPLGQAVPDSRRLRVRILLDRALARESVSGTPFAPNGRQKVNISTDPNSQ